jgi:diacylglycerol kinase
MLREPNFRIQLAIGIVAFVAGIVFRIRPVEWLALILVSIEVLVMEMLNSVIEAVVDLASPGYHPRARVAKDVAAGAVLLTSLAAVVVGLYIFGPRVLHLVGR